MERETEKGQERTRGKSRGALLNLSIVEKKIYTTMENREMVDHNMNIEDKYSAGIMMLADDRMTGQR